MAIAVPAWAAFYDLAQTNYGATIIANATNTAPYSSLLEYAIDGKLQSTHINCAYWAERTGSWFWVNLPVAYAAEMIFTNVVLRDRQNGAEKNAPFEIKIYDAGDNLLETFAYTSTLSAAAYTFTNTTSTTGASYLVYRHTGANSGDMFVAELQAIFAGDYMVSPIGFGTNSLVGLLEGGADCGELAGVQAVRFVQNDRTSQWLEFTEIEATNAAGADVSTTGIYYGNGDGSSYGAASNLVDGNTVHPSGVYLAPGWPRFAGYPPGDTDKHYHGVTMPVSTITGVRYFERDIDSRGAAGTYSNIQLEVFSDTNLAALVYSRRVAPGHHPNTWQDFKFLTGGVVRATLAAGETYRFKISGTTRQCDRLNVFQKSGSRTGIDFNGAKLRVVLAEGALIGGMSFKLFDADEYSGTLSETIFPAGQKWDTSRLYTEGIVSVAGAGALIYIQ